MTPQLKAHVAATLGPMMLVIGIDGGNRHGEIGGRRAFRPPGIRCSTPMLAFTVSMRRGVPAIEAEFPGVTRQGRVDRTLLAAEIAGKPERLKTLESIVHPLVVEAEIDF